MKRIYFIIGILLLGIFAATKPANAKVNETLLHKYRGVYEEEGRRILYDKKGNVYLQYHYDRQSVELVSTPDAKLGNTTLVIPEYVEIAGEKYSIAGVGTDDIYDTGEDVFSIGTGYKKIIFGKNVEMVERYTFPGYETIEEIQFLGDNIYIGENAFGNCENLKQIIGSERIVCMGQWAFSGTAITNIIISDKCERINELAFADCNNLKEIPDISKVKYLEGYIFSGCKGLKKVIVPNGTKEIPEHMFSNCTNLKEVYIPKSVKEIGEGAFWGCIKLKGNVTIEPKNKYLSAKDNMILNKKGDTLLSMISPVKVMVIPSYVKKVKSYWAQDYIYSEGPYGENPKYLLKTIIVQNKDISFSKRSVPYWYSPGYCKQKINILYPNTRGAFPFTKKQLADKNGRKVDKYDLAKSYTQRPYTLHPAPTRVKAKLKKGKVQVSFKKLKNSAVKKYKITYRIKKNGIYQVQKEKVIKGKRATLCSLKKGEICEVRVCAYTKQSGVWVPGKFSRMVKVRRKA